MSIKHFVKYFIKTFVTSIEITQIISKKNPVVVVTHLILEMFWAALVSLTLCPELWNSVQEVPSSMLAAL